MRFVINTSDRCAHKYEAQTMNLSIRLEISSQ